MLRYAIKRIVISIPLLLCVAFLSFLMIHLAPGDYFDTLKTNPLISPETIEQYKNQYHLNEPIYVQFFYWAGNLAQGDLGYSFVRKAPVLTVISQYAINTLILTLTAIFIIWLIAVPLGILSAVKRNSAFDRSISVISLIGISLPSFILAIIFLYIASFIPGMPVGGIRSLNYDSLLWYQKIWDIVSHLLVPAGAIVVLSIAGLLRITRANMLDVLHKPFILAAHARGLASTTVYKHAFKNTLNPLITMLGYEFAALLSGAAIIEIICNWPGLGSVMLEAVLSQDLFLVMGGIMMGSVLMIIGNLIADILLCYNDPRIKLQ